MQYTFALRGKFRRGNAMWRHLEWYPSRRMREQRWGTWNMNDYTVRSYKCIRDGAIKQFYPRAQCSSTWQIVYVVILIPSQPYQMGRQHRLGVQAKSMQKELFLCLMNINYCSAVEKSDFPHSLFLSIISCSPHPFPQCSCYAAFAFMFFWFKNML